MHKTATDKNEIIGYFRQESDSTSLSELLAPKIIYPVTNSCIKGKKSEQFIALALSILNKKLSDLISSSCSVILPLASSNSNISSTEINEAISGVVNQFFNIKTATAKETSFLSLKDRFIRLSLINYQLMKLADDADEYKEKISVAVASYFKKLLPLIFKVGLGLSGNNNFSSYATPTAKEKAPTTSSDKEPSVWEKFKQKFSSKPVSHQTLFKISSQYRDVKIDEDDPWRVYGVSNDYNSIKDMLTRWTHEVYDGVSDFALQNSLLFEKQVLNIMKFNIYIDVNFIYIPEPFRSKKETVDFFIDEVAEIYSGKPLSSPPSTAVPSPEAPAPATSSKKTKPQPIDEEPAAKPSEKAPEPSAPKTYPISIKNPDYRKVIEGNARARKLVSVLTPEEQSKIEQRLDSMSTWDKLMLKTKSEGEISQIFKQMVREENGQDAYDRVCAADR